MADLQSRPENLPASGRNDAESTNRATYATVGIATGSPVVAVATNQNTITQQTDRNLRYLQERALLAELILGSSSSINSALGGVGLVYPLAVGLTQAPSSTDVYLLDGNILDLRQSVLDTVGESTHTFPDNTQIWIYATGARIEPTLSEAASGSGAPAPDRDWETTQSN